MDFIAHMWWLWLLIVLPLLVFQSRDRRPNTAREILLAAAGLLLMISIVLNFFPPA